MPSSERPIDFSRIRFPSDKLSFGILRKKFPELIDAGTTVTLFELPELNPHYHAENLTSLLESEREIAMMAFCTVLGKKWKHSVFSERELKQFLAEDYIRYGLASGMQHARQMIRDIEAAGAMQARRASKGR